MERESLKRQTGSRPSCIEVSSSRYDKARAVSGLWSPEPNYSIDFLSSEKALMIDVTMPTKAITPEEMIRTTKSTRSPSAQPSKKIQTPRIAGAKAPGNHGIGPKTMNAIDLAAAVVLFASPSSS